MTTIRPHRHASWLSILFLAVALAACTAPSSGGASSAPDGSAPAPAMSEPPATAAPGGDDYEYGS